MDIGMIWKGHKGKDKGKLKRKNYRGKGTGFKGKGKGKMTGKGKATEEAMDRQEKDKERTSMEERTTVKEKVSHRAFCSRMPIYQIQQQDDYKHEATCDWHNGNCDNNWCSHNFNDQQPVADTHQQHENVSTSQQQASAPTGQQQQPTTCQIGTVTGGTGSGLKTVTTPERHIRFQIGQQQYINKVIIAPTSTTATAARPNMGGNTHIWIVKGNCVIRVHKITQSKIHTRKYTVSAVAAGQHASTSTRAPAPNTTPRTKATSKTAPTVEEQQVQAPSRTRTTRETKSATPLKVPKTNTTSTPMVVLNDEQDYWQRRRLDGSGTIYNHDEQLHTT